MSAHNTILAIFVGIGLLVSCSTNPSKEDVANHVHKEKTEQYQLIDSLFNSSPLPNLVYAEFTADSILEVGAFGTAGKDAMTSSHQQYMASVSKTMIAVCLMKMIDDGMVNLDDRLVDHVNIQLPEDLHGITLKQLATHTSGITDPEWYNKSYVFENALNKSEWPEAWHDHLDALDGNPKMRLAPFLNESIERDPTSIIATEVAEDGYEYSNIGASLLALAVENKSGKSFEEYCQANVFGPLKMQSAVWDHTKVKKMAIGQLENGHPCPQYYLNTYPDGGLICSVDDLIKFGQEVMKGYQGNQDANRLLSQEGYQTMFSHQGNSVQDDIGVLWELTPDCCIGHSGNDFGTSTMLYFEKESGVGRILTCSISMETEEIEEAYYSIWNVLFEK